MVITFSLGAKKTALNLSNAYIKNRSRIKWLNTYHLTNSLVIAEFHHFDNAILPNIAKIKQKTDKRRIFLTKANKTINLSHFQPAFIRSLIKKPSLSLGFCSYHLLKDDIKMY